MNLLFLVDGVAFVVIGLIVLAVPSPQPALTRPVDDVALPPFAQTRRLLASQFIGNGLFALVVGVVSARADVAAAVVPLAAAVRLATLALVLGINVTQLRSGAWKRPPLLVIGTVLTALAVGYVRVLVA